MDSSGINAELDNEVAALSVDKSTTRGNTPKSFTRSIPYTGGSRRFRKSRKSRKFRKSSFLYICCI